MVIFSRWWDGLKWIKTKQHTHTVDNIMKKGRWLKKDRTYWVLCSVLLPGRRDVTRPQKTGPVLSGPIIYPESCWAAHDYSCFYTFVWFARWLLRPRHKLIFGSFSRLTLLLFTFFFSFFFQLLVCFCTLFIHPHALLLTKKKIHFLFKVVLLYVWNYDHITRFY